MMITRHTLCCCLLAALALHLPLNQAQAKEGDARQSLNLLRSNQTQLCASVNSTPTSGIEDVSDESISASILKLSHQPAPNSLQATPYEHQGPGLGSRPERNVNQRAGQQAAPSDKGHRFNVIMDPILIPHQQPAQSDSSKTKRKGLMSFMSQPRKLSISSLLPMRSSGTKQTPVPTNNSSSQTNSNKGKLQQQQQQQQQLSNNFLAGAMSEDEFNTMLNEPNAFNTDNSPFLNGLSSLSPLPPLPPRDPRYPPPINHPLQDHHHHHHHQHHLPSPLDNNNPMAGGHFDAGQLMHSPHFVPPPAYHFGFHQPVGSAQRAATPQEIFLADQSGEHFQKIKLNKLNSLSPAGGQSLPFILASTSPTVDSQQQQQLNRTALLQAAAQQLTTAAAAAALAQQQRQAAAAATAAASSQSQAGAGNASAALTSVAANALLSDRAKNLINQLNIAAANASKSSVRNNRETTGQPAANGNLTSGGSNNGLANMIKNAAEAWATSNSMQSAPSQSMAASGSLSADASPTIIVEHDGPTVTTLDYGIPRPMGPTQAPEDDDDVTANFYTETEQAEQEEGGSHEARRVVHPRPNHNGRRSHHRHAPHQSLRHPDFGEAAPPSGGYTTGDRGALVPSANEFFDEQMMSDPHSEGPPHRPPTGNQVAPTGSGDYGPHSHPSYYQQQTRRPPSVQSAKDRYPDSINAIKEHQEDRHVSGRGKQSSSAGISTTGSDPVEQLIRELQELHRRRKSSSFSSGGRDGEEQDRGSSRGSPKGASSDEFEDILSVSGGNRDNQDNQQDGGGAADEDEQMRLLRNKLLDRLRAKHDRKKGAFTSSSSSSSTSSLNGDSIRIPLHALLLAALDRRMSPSESKSVSTSADGSPGASGLLDDRNKDLILSGRQDFNEATADLGTLLDGNNLFEQIIQSAHGAGSQQSQQLNANSDDSLRLPLNLQNISQESLTPAGMLLIENLASLDEANQKRINLSDVGGGGGGNNIQFYSAATTRMPATVSSGSGSSTTTSTTTTTATPTTNFTSTNAPQQQRDAELDLQRHRGGHLRQTGQRSFKNHRDASSGGAQKGRRALRDEGDFDVDRHVDEYANDKNDRSLEPSWMKSDSRRIQRGGGRPRDGAVEFDDEFDEIDRQTRRKMQQQKRRRGARGNKNGGNKNHDDEANYEANEQRFFNKMQRDTDANIGDVDQTIRGIEQSIPDNERPAPRRGRGHQRGQSRSDEDEEGDEASGNPNTGDDEGEGGESGDDEGGGKASESRRSRSHPRPRSPEVAESQQNAATVRASMIDDEIRRIEEEGEAKQKRQKLTQRRAESEQPDTDSEENEQQDDSGSEPSESQIEESRQVVAEAPPTLPPDKTATTSR